MIYTHCIFTINECLGWIVSFGGKNFVFYIRKRLQIFKEETADLGIKIWVSYEVIKGHVYLSVLNWFLPFKYMSAKFAEIQKAQFHILFTHSWTNLNESTNYRIFISVNSFQEQAASVVEE